MAQGRRRTVHTATLVGFLLAAVGVAAPLAPAAAADVQITAPAAGGVIKAGNDLRFSLGGAGCDDLVSHVVVSDGETAVAGPPATGCDGTATAPQVPAELQDADAAAELVVSQAGMQVASQPLNLRRRNVPDEMNREIAVEPTTDPRGGGTQLDSLKSGDTLTFAGIDLTGISSVSFRIASGGNGAHFELRDGAADGPLLGEVQAAGTGGWDSWISTSAGLDPELVPDGAFDLVVVVLARPYEPVTWPWSPPHPRDLPVVCGLPAVGDSEACDQDLVHLNHVEFNGSGASEPWQFPPDGPDFVTIFDGESLDGWKMAGPGKFHLTEHGEACTEGTMGLLWYAERTYEDFVMRAEFKVTTFRDNSGIFVRFPDPGDDPWVAVDEGYEIQIDDSFPSFQRTGTVYTFSAAEPLESNAVGEWNRLEITVVDQEYRVVLNGVEVTTYQGSRSEEGYVGLQNNDYFEGSQTCFRDIRVQDL